MIGRCGAQYLGWFIGSSLPRRRRISRSEPNLGCREALQNRQTRFRRIQLSTHRLPQSRLLDLDAGIDEQPEEREIVLRFGRQAERLTAKSVRYQPSMQLRDRDR
jgi:hypothetical protein